MPRRKQAAVVLAAAVALGATPAAQADPEYTFTLVDAFVTNYSLRECYIYDLNDQNVACGTATIQNQSMITYTGFHWSPPNDKTPVGISWPHGINDPGLMAGVTQVYDIPTDQFTTVPLLPATYYPLALNGVNDAGVAVGYVQICNCSNSQGMLQIPYVWDAANGARSLSVPGATGAARINNNGLVVGWIGGWSAPNSYMYDLNTDTYTIMSTLFSGINTKTTATDINDNDVVVGSRMNSNGTMTQGYTWSAEVGVTLLPLPPAGYQPYLQPASINDSGVIVGSIYTPTASSRAFVYDEAHGVRDLNELTIPSPGFTLMTATAVNNNGWIAGYGYGGGGMYKSYVLTPILSSDLDGDGTVGAADLGLLLGNWGSCAECNADLSGDGAVDADDLAVMLGSWG